MAEIVDLAERRRALEAASQKADAASHEVYLICRAGGMCEPTLEHLELSLLTFEADGRVYADKRMSARDALFLRSIAGSFAEGRREFSPKQVAWLWDIARRHGV